MISFSVLLALLIPLLIFYLDIFIHFKKEIDDIKAKEILSTEDTKRIRNRKDKLMFLSIITVISILVIIVLYILPVELLNNIKPINIFDLFPFKKGFFKNSNFKISYITELIISSLSIIIWFVLIKIGREVSFGNDKNKNIFVILHALLFLYASIWLNYYISNFLVASIIQSFVLLSIIFNIVIYIIIDIIAIFIYLLFNALLFEKL